MESMPGFSSRNEEENHARFASHRTFSTRLDTEARLVVVFYTKGA